MVSIENVSKSFGAQLIFDCVSLKINSGERVGLVGRNGHGKTTLMRMLTGEELPDSGTIAIPKNYRIASVSQTISFTEKTVLSEGMKRLVGRDETGTWELEKILSGLGFSSEEMNRDPSLLSGGFQVRLNLASALVSNPDLLLLDEPTNYLDVVSIRWLSRFLVSWKRELLLVTHDRSFMNGVITHTAGIHRKKIRKIPGNTDKLYSQIIKEEEIYEKTRINDDKKRRESEIFISRFRAKARLAGLVQSRIKALEKNAKNEKLENIKDLEFSFNYSSFAPKVLMKADRISFSYNASAPLIRDFLVSVNSGDRICIIGRNGKGKSTLMKIMARSMSPDSGEIISHQNISAGYFAQTNSMLLNPSLTVEDEIMLSGCDRQKARDIAAAMMFEGDMALKKTAVLSGGEKSRVLLAKLIAKPCNLIFLDEPTNHLDMESCDALIAALDSFEGAVVMITHNELFLHNLAEKFIVFQGEFPFVFEGDYRDFLGKVGWEEERADAGFTVPSQDNVRLNRKEYKRAKGLIIARKSSELGPLALEIEKTENGIKELEEEFSYHNRMLIEVSEAGRGADIASHAKNLHILKHKLDAAYGYLEKKMIQIETREKEYMSELAEIERKSN